MKVFLLTLALIGTSCFAEVYKPNLYQKDFDVEKSARFFRILNVQVKNVPRMIERVVNYDFDVYEGRSPYLTTVLQKEKVVQVTITYEHNEWGEIDEGTILVNLPLSMFTNEELDIFSKMISLKKLSIIKKYIALKTETVKFQTKSLICADHSFDDYNRPLSECPRLVERVTNNSKNVLSVVLK